MVITRITQGEGGLKSAEIVSHIIWMASKHKMSMLFMNWNLERRRVICLKFICSKKLLNTKILVAQHCLSRWQKYMNLLENQKSMPYMFCQADAFFRQKWITAWIAIARQKIWKCELLDNIFCRNGVHVWQICQYLG